MSQLIKDKRIEKWWYNFHNFKVNWSNDFKLMITPFFCAFKTGLNCIKIGQINLIYVMPFPYENHISQIMKTNLIYMTIYLKTVK